jgi:hypothetical protein
MRLIFFSDPVHPHLPDTAFQTEVAAAKALDLAFDVISYESLIAHKNDSFETLPVLRKNEICILRGWMLTPAQYSSLFTALERHQRILVNTPDAYRHCHYLPENYDIIQNHTAFTVFLPVDSVGFHIDQVFDTVRTFGSAPIVLKDYVKSQKHEWLTACFIPNASDNTNVQQVVNRFLELQGSDLNEGLCFRAFLDFEQVGHHAQSGVPLMREFRQFYFDGQLIARFPYWDQGSYGSDVPDPSLFLSVATRIKSRFFSMDIARLKSGHWKIIELGDGQVTGLPENAHRLDFFKALKDRT